MRLPRTRSMRLKSEFSKVRKEGRSFAGRFLVLSVLPAEELENSKVGFIVPKRVGNAVARNLVKRRLHGVVAGKVAAIGSKYFVVTIARKGAAEQSFAVLESEWHRLAKRAKLYRPTAPASDNQLSSNGADDPMIDVRKVSSATRHQNG